MTALLLSSGCRRFGPSQNDPNGAEDQQEPSGLLSYAPIVADDHPPAIEWIGRRSAPPTSAPADVDAPQSGQSGPDSHLADRHAVIPAETAPVPVGVASEPDIVIDAVNVPSQLSVDAVTRVLRRRLRDVGACLAVDDPPEGHATVPFGLRIEIGPLGSVLEAELQPDRPASDLSRACAVAVVRRWAFPTPEGGTRVTANVRLRWMRASLAQQADRVASGVSAALYDPEDSGRGPPASPGSQVGFREHGFDLSQRVHIVAASDRQAPVPGSLVTVRGFGWEWNATTHPDGGCDLFPSFVGPHVLGPLHLVVEAPDGTRLSTSLHLRRDESHRDITVRFRGRASRVGVLDLAFVLDAGFDMSDVLGELPVDVAAILRSAGAVHPRIRVRLSATMLQQRDGIQSVVHIPFGSAAPGFLRSLADLPLSERTREAGGLEFALEAALSRARWANGNSGHVIALLVMGGQRVRPETAWRWRAFGRAAVSRGIRIVPIIVGGDSGDVEPVFRALAALTGTPWLHVASSSRATDFQHGASARAAARGPLARMLGSLLASELQGQGMRVAERPE